MARLIPICLIVVWCAAGMVLFCHGSHADDQTQAGHAPVARKVSSQEEARAEARKVDLPLLKHADKVILEKAVPAGKGRPIALTRLREIQALRETLKPRDVPPSGGMVAATLTFYQGKRPLRTVWVYEGGEWGFERVGTHYTTGANAKLWDLLQHLQ